MSNELWRLSAVEIARGIRAREYSCHEVITNVLARMDRLNPSLNAITVDCRDEALTDASRADDALRRGDPLGPLHGVPVTIKENVDQRGRATPNGVPAFADLVAADDSPVTANLRRAGAIIVGRTNTPEFSMRATTDNPLRGRTRNPWREDESPGGSSGGAGAAAAAGFGPIHHGNDIGGSLRFPSFACGVATVKPTQGRVPAFNPTATAERGMLAQLMSVQGTIAREVCDVRLGTRVMAEGDPRDPWWVPAPFDGAPVARPIRVAVTRESHGYPIHPEIDAAISRAAAWLNDAGYAVDEVATPSILEAANGWFDVATYEIKMTLDPLARQHGSDTVQRIFDWYYSLGHMVDADGYRRGIADRTRLTRAWSVFLDRYPLVLSPFLMRPTFPWNYDAESEANTHDLFRAAIWSVGVNYLGLPAGVVPVGTAAELPAGVQIIGRRYREDLILDAMEAVEGRAGIMAQELWRRPQFAAGEPSARASIQGSDWG
jgi:amidase